MLDLMQHDSDGDLGSGPFNSSSQTSSMSSSASGFGRCSSTSRSSSSFDGAGGLSSCASPAARRRPPTPAALSSKPHQRSSSDPSWAAIRRRAAPLGPKDFNLLRRIGSGDIGTVYLCRLRDTDADDERKGNANSSSNPLLYAMKVVDKRELERKKKLGRAEAERRVLRSLDHPFLPTLYADFDAGEHYSCVVMEFCPAGDLHSLRHRLPSSRFPLPAARFYAAEVLVALEYLHMLGVVYRDLKPENVLIRPDGHIMLSDFDLSFESTASPTLDVDDDPPFLSTPSCLPTPRLFSSTTKSTTPKRSGGILRRCRSATAALGRRAFVAEPVEARSLSFVGTHEYVAPEVATGREHGSAVDWWAFGVFLYELLHGRTPFVGTTNESTLRNIVKQPLSFPAFSGGGGVDSKARDLIARLLNKDPGRRLGSRRGAADVKEHPFFAGLNFALLRSHRPPVVPGGPVVRPKAKEPGRFEHF